MRLVLTRSVSRNILGAKSYHLIAQVVMDAEEKKAFDDFGLMKTLLYSGEKKVEKFRQFAVASSGVSAFFSKFIGGKRAGQITALDLVVGLKFQSEFVLSILELEAKVVEAANVLDAAVTAVTVFSGEESLDLPIG